MESLKSGLIWGVIKILHITGEHSKAIYWIPLELIKGATPSMWILHVALLSIMHTCSYCAWSPYMLLPFNATCIHCCSLALGLMNATM